MNYKQKLHSLYLKTVYGHLHRWIKILINLKKNHRQKTLIFLKDWIGSTTTSRQPLIRENTCWREFLMRVLVEIFVRFDELISLDPNYFLGEPPHKGIWFKPNVTCEVFRLFRSPTFSGAPYAEFAREHSQQQSWQSGRLLQFFDVRESTTNPYVYVGFQHPPSRKRF